LPRRFVQHKASCHARIQRFHLRSVRNRNQFIDLRQQFSI
jgi:hypothetical protein